MPDLILKIFPSDEVELTKQLLSGNSLQKVIFYPGRRLNFMASITSNPGRLSVIILYLKRNPKLFNRTKNK